MFKDPIVKRFVLRANGILHDSTTIWMRSSLILKRSRSA